jgi:hypothetical protein
MARASSASAGLPTIRPSTTQTVSAASTSRGAGPSPRAASAESTWRALNHASPMVRRAGSSVAAGSSASSIAGGSTSNRIPAAVRMAWRRGEELASTTSGVGFTRRAKV